MTRRNHGWENVCTPNASDYTERLRVDGGWLYRTVLFEPAESSNISDFPPSVALVFVPAPPVPNDPLMAKLEQLLECRQQ